MRHIAAEEGQETTGQSGEPGSGKHTGGAHTLSSGQKRFPRGGLRDSQTRREYRVGQGVRKVKQAENVQSSREEECLGQRVYVLGRDAGTLIPSAQHFVWAAKQPLGSAALGALFA